VQERQTINTQPVPFSTPRYIPILKWAGGKSSLLPQYAPFFPTHVDRFFEPFVGSAAVFFFLRSRDFAHEYFLSDLNPELINLYCVVKNDLDALIARLREHKGQHSKEHYYDVRKMDREDINKFSDVERAARMIYLNRTCFNGLWRVNSKGHFNVPMGDYKNPAILDETRLRNAAEALAEASVALAGFEKVQLTAKAGDFIYFDPPYIPLSPTASFTSYSSDDFGEADQRRLAIVFRELHERGCKVMLSNSDVPLIHELYKDWRIETVTAARRINSDASKRGVIFEALVMNYD
jgi:DNA adenine methylase